MVSRDVKIHLLTTLVFRLDDIFQDAFERCTTFNHFAFHSVTPLATIPVRTYSASKSALTGIIEAPDTLKLVAKTFAQVTALFYYSIIVQLVSLVKLLGEEIQGVVILVQI